MAMRIGRVSQDQNFSVHFDGAPVVKTNGSTVQKKGGGGIGGRKALNDISNSGKPSAFQASRKNNTKNVIPISEDIGVSKKTKIPVDEKATYVAKPPGKSQVSGRKALSDLTNSTKPFEQQKGLKNKSRGKSLIAVDENDHILESIAGEGFLHNHQECVKSQTALDLDQFLKTVGLYEDVPSQSVSECCPLPRKAKDESAVQSFGTQELSELIIEDLPHEPELFLSGQSSPVCGSPKSPKLSYMTMKDFDDFPSFILADSPRQSS